MHDNYYIKSVDLRIIILLLLLSFFKQETHYYIHVTTTMFVALPYFTLDISKL